MARVFLSYSRKDEALRGTGASSASAEQSRTPSELRAIRVWMLLVGSHERR